MGKIIINNGRVFNFLTVLYESEPRISTRKGKREGKIKRERVFHCLCACGTISDVLMAHMIRGKTKSCGCHRSAVTTKMKTTHNKSKTTLYKRWKSIRLRCYQVNNLSYSDYGGRGIKMCDEWKNDYMSFHEWAVNSGFDDSLQIDRIDNNGNYEPSNCRWVTSKQNCNNRRSNIIVKINEIEMTLKAACEKLNMKYKAVHARIHNCGWSLERALYTPIKQK